MDPPRKPITTPSTHLKPPPHHTPRPTSTSSTTSSTTTTPRAPVTAHPTATIADSAVFQGTHPISIGAGTIIHPRTRIYSFHGPVIIEETCIIGEKSVIGTPPPAASTSTSTSPGPGPGTGGTREDSTLPLPITLSPNVTLGPSVTIHPGTRISNGVLIEALATLHARVTVGSHSKICAGCEVSSSTALKEWMVLWGSVGSGGLRRRVRARGRMSSATALAQMGTGGGQALEARVIEEARLVVLEREREVLGRLIGGASGGGGRRR